MINIRRNVVVAACFLLMGAAALLPLINPPVFAQKNSTGMVFALTNVAEENEVVVYSRATDGTLSLLSKVSTGGNGTGSPLDSQGALILNEANTRLYACNPGSDEISVFEVGAAKPRLIQRIASGGDLPLSLTIHDKLLYVLNSGTGSNIFGFQVGLDGRLSPLANSFRRLTTLIGSPAQIQFNPEGNVLVVTHKATDVLRPPQNIIDTFTVGTNGLPSMPIPHPSNGIRPFGFAFRNDGVIVVSESFNVLPNESAASSYRVFSDGSVQLITGSVGNMQTDACWVVITNDGLFAFVTNFLSGTISSYNVALDGSLSLLNGAAAMTGMMSQPEDMDLSLGGQFLYVLLTGAGQVAAFRIEANGGLTPLGNAGGVPPMAGATGLAAF
jgi:6-phosphogluconolactonase (cycloisomerase 2 family)